jgi:D-alanyl-D-alanine carboxypeptidase (penicillin-binding protein 5/6)
MRALAGLLVALMLGVMPGRAAAIEQSTPARAAILVDLASDAVLFEKNADTPLPPASMSKLMTLDVVFEALESGRLSLDDETRVSAAAASLGGSSMFLREGEVVSIEDLLRGVIVQSGNDASVALAEELAGTEAAFADHLNERGKAIGLETSHFENATGWPHPDHVMSARDLARVAERLVEAFPQYYPMFAEEEFGFDGRVPANRFNRNPLLGIGIGADGLKTGHTEEAGYGLVASAKRGNRRVVLVVTGLETAAQRKQEAERLINWAFRAFETRRLYEAGEPVLEAETWIGMAETVGLAPARDVIVTVPFGTRGASRVSARYDAPVEAPVEAGAELGTLIVEVDDMAPVEVPLVAAEDVARGGFRARLEAALVRLTGRVAAEAVP